MSDQEQLTPQQEREYVEAAWQRAEIMLGSTNQYAVSLGDSEYTWHCTDWFANKLSAWHAASLYTKEHKGELKRRRYAISLLKLIYAQGGQGEWKPVDWKQDQEALEQVIAREQAALADLLRGWRENGDGNGRG